MKYFLTFFLIVHWSMLNAQDSLEQNARSFHVYSGLPFKKVTNKNIWHHPDFELGFDFQHSIKVNKSFFFSFGFGLTYSQYRTEAYFQEWLTVAYSPLSGTAINSYFDDYERQTLGQFATIHVPVQLEYIPTGKWKPYARMGISFDAEIIDRSVEVYANTLKRAPEHVHATPNQVYSDDYLLSVISSGGVKHQIGNTSVLFGLYGQVGLLNANTDGDVGRVGIGAEFTLRKTLPQKDFQYTDIDTLDSYLPKKRKYIYFEVFGSSFASFNFEFNLVGNNSNGLNAKLGLGLGPNGSVLPVGLSWTFGGRRGGEVGFDVAIDFTDHSDSYFVPRVGYRWELNDSVLLRFTIAGWRTDSFYVTPGFSVGKRLSHQGEGR